MTLNEKLLNGEKQIGIWGLGYIGYSSMAYFASKGIKCLGVDVDVEKVDKINRGNLPIDNIEYWLGFDTKPLVKSGLMKATTDWTELISKDIPVHLICIPTEKDDVPYDGIYYCPHHPEDNCDCRKPKPKLILQAAKEHSIDLGQSFVVGDLSTDIRMGEAVGCTTVLLRDSPLEDKALRPDYIASDLLEAIQRDN